MPKQLCIIGEYCNDHGYVHGAEAEELRSMIEDLCDASGKHVNKDELLHLLEIVDARDSVAYLDRIADEELPSASLDGRET